MPSWWYVLFLLSRLPSKVRKGDGILVTCWSPFFFSCPIFGGEFTSHFTVKWELNSPPKIPAFVISAILMIRTYFVEQTPEESRKRRRYLGCMLVSFLLFLLFFGGVILMLSCVIDWFSKEFSKQLAIYIKLWWIVIWTTHHNFLTTDSFYLVFQALHRR